MQCVYAMGIGSYCRALHACEKDWRRVVPIGEFGWAGDNSCELSRAMISEKGITGGTGWAGVGLVRVGGAWQRNWIGGVKGLCV